MLYKNAFLFPGDKPPFLGSFRVEDGIFTEVLDCIPDEAGVDLESAWVIPGLVDIHTHGNSGADFSDGSYEGLLRMGSYLAAHGITSFAPGLHDTARLHPFRRLSGRCPASPGSARRALPG